LIYNHQDEHRNSIAVGGQEIRMTSLIGQSLGRYHILEQLGEGGMATVYKAYDTRLETDVAVKFIRTEELSPKVLERALKRFEREAKSLARLTHANIVKVTDYGEYEGSPYLVMEYLPGGTLKQKLAGRPMAWQETIKILLPIARALDYAHRLGVIHRDVKPANILITADGDPVLTDFGIAKIIAEESTLDLTGTSAAVGTPEYMAPEQATAKFVDKRADIYSFGIVLYEMVTGRKPFTADTPMAVLIKQATEPLPRPAQFVRDLPPRLEQILLKALAKNPDDRYQSMGELANALEEMAQNTKTVKPMPRQPTRNETVTIADKKPAPTPAPSPVIGKAKKDAGENPAWRKWLPLGGLVILLGIALAIGNGLLDLGKQGMGPLSDLATETATPTNTNTATPTKTLTPTVTFTPTPTATFTPTPSIGSAWTRPSDGMVMMFVPESAFEMGSNTSSDEKPIHTVTLDTFWMDQTEVTNQMYALCVQAGTCHPPKRTKSYTRSSYYGNSQYDNFPVIYVDWNMAKTYCEWADARLPTEAEWEKAARGADGRTYPWGNDSPNSKLLNYNNNVGDTTEVGKYPAGASIYNVLDMAGNVWEWVMDWYDSNYYANSPSSNPQCPSSGDVRVLRGGSWGGNEFDVRSAFRVRGDPSNIDLNVGFRCALSP
jgi:serine/threonine-protein kinase